MAERLVLGASNHKVISVASVVEQEDVFCLSVPGLNNFALADGVFVHNCGNMAVRLDVPFDAIKGRIGTILADIRQHVSFGVGRVNNTRAEHNLFDDLYAWRASGMKAYRLKAKTQLGTVGSGNHYVDLMRDEAGFVWVGVHFGSRGLGHTSATKYLKLAGGQDGMNVPPAVVDEDSELGHRYIAAMELAGRYAYAGREWVVERVRQIIGGAVTDSVHNHHNYCVASFQIVQTASGPKRMDEIVPGDVHEAMTHAGGPPPDFVLLDVRGPAAYARSHVPGALNLPHREMMAERMADWPKGTLFVVHCAGPHCNGADRAALRLARLGRSVKLMLGGMTGWADEGFAFASGEAPGSVMEAGTPVTQAA